MVNLHKKINLNKKPIHNNEYIVDLRKRPIIDLRKKVRCDTQ